METAIVKGETAPIARELKIPPVSDDRDTIIQSCYELLCSSRPLAEVLDEAKRLRWTPIVRQPEPSSKV